MEFFFPLLKPKVVYLRSVLSSLPFLKFFKQNFMNFGHKHVETGPNFLHELATFLKYQIPLTKCFKTIYNYTLKAWINKTTR